MKKILEHIITKSIVLTLLPFAYGVIVPLILTEQMNAVIKDRLFWIALAAIVIHIGLLIFYGKSELQKKTQIENTEATKKELENAKELIKTANKVVLDNANMFHELVYNKKGHSDIEDWHLLENKGDTICQAVYNHIRNIAVNGNDFSVSMMFKKLENNRHGYTMLSRVATNFGHNPYSYRNFVPEADANGFYYKKIFDEKPTKPQVLHNRKAIRDNFQNGDALDYTQYIAVPITCRGNKIVGILQIVAYNDSIIARKKKELEKIANDYFSLCATLMLLCDKYENVQQLLK